jgi:hypothetical protein
MGLEARTRVPLACPTAHSMSFAVASVATWARRAAQPAAARGLHTSAAALAAVVRKPAPAFSAAAVVDEAFKTVSLADYKGQCKYGRVACAHRSGAAGSRAAKCAGCFPFVSTSCALIPRGALASRFNHGLTHHAPLRDCRAW